MSRTSPSRSAFRERGPRALVAVTVGAVAAIVAVPAVGAAATPPVVAPPAGYPDGRQPEMVSSVEKNGGEVVSMWPAGDDGNAVMYSKSTSSEDSESAAASVPAIARRTADGWTRTDATVRPTGAGGYYRPWALSPAFDRMLVSTLLNLGTDDDDQGNDNDVYNVDISARRASLLTKPVGVTSGPFDLGNSRFIGASVDLSTAVFTRSASGALLPESGSTDNVLYRSRGGNLEVISRLPDGQVVDDSDGAVAAPSSWDRGMAPYSDPAAYFPGPAPIGGGWTHNVSDDGDRVFFGVVSQGIPRLYVRDGDRTVAVSASRRAGENGALREGRFIGASADGGTVYFASPEALTDGVDGGGIYRYRLDADELERLTPDPGAGFDITNAWTSDDASTVSFVTSAALTPNATEGQANAYIWRAGDLKLVTSAANGARVERVSRDGRFTLLSSTGDLGGAQTGGFLGLYVYDATDETLRCASCRQDGSPNAADAILENPLVDGIEQAIPGTRNITDDGRVFFSSSDRLVSGDDGDGVDAYEYNNGTVSLLSAGGKASSYVVDNTNDGQTVFVTTSDRLAPQDTDTGEYDLYALRIGGGFAEAPVEVPCEGEGCRPPARLPDATPTPTSTTPAPGNPAPTSSVAPAVRGKVTLSAGLRRALSRSGRGTVRIRTQGAGTLSVRGTARLSRKTTTVLTGRAKVSAKGASTTSVALRLSTRARRVLRTEGRLRVRLQVQFSGARGGTTTTVTLKSTRSAR